MHTGNLLTDYPLPVQWREKEMRDQQVTKAEAWAYSLHSTFWYYNMWQSHELQKEAEPVPPKTYPSRMATEEKEARRCASNGNVWEWWGQKGHTTVTQWGRSGDHQPGPPAPRGTGSLHLWQMERKHGCPALADLLRRGNELLISWMENNECITESSSFSLGQRTSPNQIKPENVSLLPHLFSSPALPPITKRVENDPKANPASPSPQRSPRW